MSAFASLFSKATGSANTSNADLDAIFSRPVAPPPVRAKPVVAAKPTVVDVPAKDVIKPPEAVIKAAKIAKKKSAEKGSSDSKNDNKDKKRKRKLDSAVKSSDDETDKVEGDYAKKAKKQAKAKKAGKEVINASKAAESEDNEAVDGKDEVIGDDSSSSDEEIDPSTLVHETVLQARKAGGKAVNAKAGKKPEIVETPAERDARTTFLGNVPVACATSKSSRKALVRHLISTLPEEQQSFIRLDSIRFRSLPLSAPMPLDAGAKQAAEAAAEPVKPKPAPIPADPNNHARTRSRRWRDRDDEDDEAETTSGNPNQGKQKFLTASQKRKVAFIKGEVHEKAKSCNAYAVWTTTRAGEGKDGVSPAVLAGLVVKNANNTVFEKLTLRVDSVKSGTASAAKTGKASQADQSAGEEDAASVLAQKKQLAAEQKQKLEEEKRTIYVGSLDFEETEEALRELCERLMKEERGAASPWVERVRVIKDNETGLGKGFAYILFRDRECVDEMLAMDATRVRLSKRKLRLERCKSATASVAAAKKLAAGSSKGKGAPAAAAKVGRESAFSKGNKRDDLAKGKDRNSAPRVKFSELPTPRPDIGESLRDLPKDDRKAIKVSDAERIQRRMDKKQRTREAIKTTKAKEVLDKKLKIAGKGGSADSRRSKSARDAGGKKKTRVRSDTMNKKKNTKKEIA